jgi:capsular polysaccharide biosynthesis protein/Flp pilus assembly protein TadD
MDSLFERPDFSRSLVNQTVVIDNAIIVPPPKGDVHRPIVRAGVFDATQEFIPQSITWSGTTATNTPPKHAPQVEQKLNGSYLFMGPLISHFGHFLIESVARFWALHPYKDQIDGILFYPKSQNSADEKLEKLLPRLTVLGADVPIKNILDVTQVKRLIVPPQGMGMFDLATGAPEAHLFARSTMGKSITPNGPKKLYISRSRLPQQKGSILGETALELLLEEEGFIIFHPERHSIDDQIATYRAAEIIISMDTSPLHLVALVGNPNVKIGVIPRRAGPVSRMFVDQLNSFVGSCACIIDCLVANWNHPRATRIDRHAWGEISFSKACHQLQIYGLISEDAEWPDFEDGMIEELAAEMKLTQKFVDGYSVKSTAPIQSNTPRQPQIAKVQNAEGIAKKHEALGEIDQAIMVLKHAITHSGDDNDNEHTRYILEGLYRRQNLFQESIEILEEISKNAPMVSRPHHLTALSNIGLKEYEAAINAINIAIAITPNDTTYAICRARIFNEQGRVDEAARTLRDAMPYAKSNPSFLRFLSRIEDKLGNHQNSKEAIMMALALDPDSKEFQNWNAHLDRKPIDR